MSTPVDCGQGNPDISGIGVRLSFYLQNFLLVLLVDRSWEDAPSALWTFTSTSFGLTVAAIVQAKQGQLSFFQALQVTNLVWLANFGSFLALASYSRHRTISEEGATPKHGKEEAESPRSVDARIKLNGRHVQDVSEPIRRVDSKPKPNNMVKIGAMSQMFFSMALTLVTWARPDIFSNDSDDSTDTCDVKYVAFFGVNFTARTSGRVLGLVVTSILLVGYLVITYHELQTQRKRRKARHLRKAEKERKRELKAQSRALEEGTAGQAPMVSMPTPQITTGGLPPSPATPISAAHSTLHGHLFQQRRSRRSVDPRRERRVNWGSDLDPMLLGLTIFQIIVFTYFIICTELLLKRNPISDNVDQQWGFGQILALIVVVPSAISVAQAFKEHKFGNLHHARTKGQQMVGSRRSRSLPPFNLV